MTIRAKLALFGLMAALVLALSYAVDSEGEVKQCTSSCRNITIKDLFRIKGDPLKCGDRRLELKCENNRAVLYLPSGRYYVQEISYVNYMLRVVDASLDHDKCSIPRNLIIGDRYGYPFSPFYYYNPYRYGDDYDILYVYVDVIFLNCITPVNSSLYVDVSPCTNSSSSPHTYFYAFYEDISKLDSQESCSIKVQVPVPYFNNTSPSIFDIYKQLLMGFELSWESYNYICRYKIPLGERLLNFCIALWLNHRSQLFAFIGTTGGFTSGRTTLGIFCLIAIVVYKFRQRHLSMDHVIEEFLQSQNNLMPIRYFYSDIKRMTNGFNNKIGEGGFGSVFKGKL